VFFFETIGAMVSGRVRWSCYVNGMQLRVEAQWAASRGGSQAHRDVVGAGVA
jgi:hypothetical protein